jgi:hypothetical protein
MRALFAKGNMRNSFLSSFACDSTLAQAAPLPTPETAPVSNPVDQFKVYPNPLQTSVTVEYTPAAEFEVKQISIYNVFGVKVFSAETNKGKMSFNLSSLATGVYIVRIGEGKTAYKTKLIKQ